MTQLHTEKEKYGVPVAARIDPEMAQQISERAERLGISLAKMVSLIISHGFNPLVPVRVENREQIERLEEQLTEVTEALAKLHKRHEIGRNALERFIRAISKNEDERRAHINTFNTMSDEIRDRQ